MKCESILSVFLKIYINFIKPKSMKIEIFLVAECIHRLHSAKCRLNFMLTPDFRLNLLPQWFGIRTLTITEIFIRNYYRLERKVKFRFIKLSYKIAPLFSSKTTILFGCQLLQTESIFILLFILKCDFILLFFKHFCLNLKCYRPTNLDNRWNFCLETPPDPEKSSILFRKTVPLRASFSKEIWSKQGTTLKNVCFT